MVGDLTFTFSVVGSDIVFRVEHFHIEESVSEPFRIGLTLLSLNADITFDHLSRQSAVLTLYGQGSDCARHFHGVINEFRYCGQGRRFAEYKLTLVPDYWFLGLRQNCRIFQQQTLPDIIKAVFDDASLADYRFDLSRQYSEIDYLLQYRESDRSFVERLLAEYGLWYYFEHSDSAHTLVIIDSNDAVPALESTSANASYTGALVYHPEGGGVPDYECVSALMQSRRSLTGKVTYSDYNYLTPNLPLQTSTQDAGNADLAIYDYPGRYISVAQGNQRAADAQAHLSSHRLIYAMNSNIMRVACGYQIEITAHPREELNRDYYITALSHRGSNPGVREEETQNQPATYSNEWQALAADATYKAPKWPAPVIDGPQTALVVGPAGEEIYTDEYGRIKVQFHWDRAGSNDEHSTCWVRVSQAMSASGWGAVALPRIGQEVVVTFIEGDPDRPLVTGAVYNGLNTPPYALPENKTKTVLRTQSHKATGYNELAFEDEAEQQEIAIYAQKDMRIKVLNTRYRQIEQDEELKVAGNQQNEIGGDATESIAGNKVTTTKQTLTETVMSDVTLNEYQKKTVAVKTDVTQAITDNHTLTIAVNDTIDTSGTLTQNIGVHRISHITDDESLTVGGALSVEVGANTSIKSDGNTSVISSDSIKVQTGYAGIILQKSGKVRLYGAAVTIDGSNSVTAKGGKVNLNPSAASSQNVKEEPFEEIMLYNQKVILMDQTTGVVHAFKKYKVVLDDGKVIKGMTNAKGETEIINTKDVEQNFDIYWSAI